MVYANHNYVFSMEPIRLVEWLAGNCKVVLPLEVQTPDDMEEASKKLLEIAGISSYLLELLSYGKIYVRKAKRELPKEEWEDMVDRQNAVQNAYDVSKQQYAALSRSVTIKIEQDKELFMEG